MDIANTVVFREMVVDSVSDSNREHVTTLKSSESRERERFALGTRIYDSLGVIKAACLGNWPFRGSRSRVSYSNKEKPHFPFRVLHIILLLA